MGRLDPYIMVAGHIRTKLSLYNEISPVERLAYKSLVDELFVLWRDRKPHAGYPTA